MAAVVGMWRAAACGAKTAQRVALLGCASRC